MDSRIELQQQLEAVLGSRNVYFQPPESLKLKYPCIVYDLAIIESVKADDKNYLLHNRYTVTLIHTDPDNDVKSDIMVWFDKIAMDRIYAKDNLYHYVYDLYYK